MSLVAAVATDTDHGRQHHLERLVGDNGWVDVASQYSVLLQPGRL